MSDNFYIFLNLIYSKYTWELLQQFPAKKKSATSGLLCGEEHDESPTSGDF